MEPSNRFCPDEGYRINMDMECMKNTVQRKPEKHGCFPFAIEILFAPSLFILNSQLKK